MRKNSVMVALYIALIMVIQSKAALATSTGLEIEQTFDIVETLLRGKVAWFVAVGTGIVAAIGWMMSESSSTIRTAFKWALGASVIFNIVKYIDILFGGSTGVGF